MNCKYLLDTNIISELTKKKTNKFVVEKILIYQREVATASLVIHELLYGCLRLPIESEKRRILQDYIEQVSLTMAVFDYDSTAARWHATERSRLTKIGKTPAFADGQIASIAFCNNLILVTNNVRDFEEFQDLMLENWFVE